MMKKRLLSILLVFCMVLGMLPGTAWAIESEEEEFGVDETIAEQDEYTEAPEPEELIPGLKEELDVDSEPIMGINVLTEISEPVGQVITPTSGTCGENLTWTLDSNGTLTINGTGVMENYFLGYPDYNPAPWYTQVSDIRTAVIENGVTTIGVYAFHGCSNLTSVKIPDSVTHINALAFCSCSNLTSVSIPNSVTYIGEDAFSGCSSLINVVIPNSVTRINEGTFDGCTSLTNMTIPDSVTYIDQQAFLGCRGLTNVSIPNSVTHIDESVFNGCTSLTSVTIPDSITHIDYSVFEGCTSLTSVTIPDSVTVIGYSAFSGCSSLTNVSIPNSVTYIDWYAFSGCSLKSVTIPDSVNYLGEVAFDNTLKDIYYGGSQEQWERLSKKWDHTPSFISATIHYNSTGPNDNPNPPSGDIRFDNTTYSVNIGAELPLKVHVRSDVELKNGDVTWSSSNEAVAAVTPGGPLVNTYYATVRGISRGTTTITATTRDGKSASCTVTVGVASNTIQLPNDFTLFVDDTQTVQAQITLNVLDANESIEWSSSNSNIAAFDANGTGSVSHSINGMTITDSKTTDSVQIYARSSGTAKITCRLKNAGIEQSFNVSVITVRELELQQLAMQWVNAYDAYNAKLTNTMNEAASGDIKKLTLDEVAKEFEAKLGEEYGLYVSTVIKTEERVLVYKALLEMLASYTSNQLALKNISFSNLDKVPIDICKNVLNALRNETYVYTDEETGASVRLSLSDFAGAKWGFATIQENGKWVPSVAISSSTSSVQAVITDYTSQLLELEKSALKKSAKEAVAALSKELLGKSISTLKEDFIKNQVSKYTDQFNKLGLGDVVGFLNSCYNYYQFIDKIIGGDFSNLAGMLDGTKDIDFAKPDFATNVTKKVVSKLDNVQKEILKLLNKGITGKEEWFSIEVPKTSSTFGCPVNITVYDSRHTEVGYVGDDDLWFNEDIVYIEQNGDSKTVYSRDEALTFDIVATDYGTLNCTFEEYSGGAAISRINYYDILLYANKEIKAEIPNSNLSEYTVTVTSGAESIPADESITDYTSSTINVVCSADNIDGGQVYGSGQYVRGDAVKLLALVEDGYAFLGWQNSDGALVSISPVYEFTARADVRLTALFAKNAIPDAIIGDLTGDGKITMADVIRLARGAANYVTLTEQEQKMGDVTGDGKITMADVIRLARHAAGYIPSL